MKDIIKKIIPGRAWNVLRSWYIKCMDLIEMLGPETQIIDYFGYNVYYNRGNTLIKRVKKENIFEQDLSEDLVKELSGKNKPVLLDIGANLGIISLYTLSKVQGLKIFAFEPGPVQGDMFERTIKENGLSEKVDLYKLALSEKDGQQTFYTHVKSDQAKDGLEDTGRGEETVAIEVKTKTLDTWWEEEGQPSVHVIKMDTEGAELFILRAGKEFIKKEKPIIYLEINNTNLDAYPYSSKDIIEFLNKLHYRINTLDGIEVDTNNVDEISALNDTFKAVPF